MNEEVTESEQGETGKRSDKRLSNALRLFISAALIVVVLTLVDSKEFVRAAANVKPLYLLIVIALVMIDRVIVVHKWNLLLVSKKVQISFPKLFSIYSVASISGFVLPTTVGGDLFRIFRLSQFNVSKRVSIASITVERVLGFVSMLLIAGIGLGISLYLLSERYEQLIKIFWVLGAAMFGCVFLFFLVRHESLNEQLEKFVSGTGRSKLAAKLHGVYAQCRDYRNDGVTLLKVSIYTLVRQTVPIFMTLVLAVAFGIDASMLELFAIVPIIILGSRLPISMDGIGVQEGLYVVMFGFIGVSATEALLLSLAFRVLVLVTLVPFAVQYIVMHKKTVKPELDNNL